MMSGQKRYSVAIETSGRLGGGGGSVSLGRDDRLLDTVAVGAERRHAVGLMPALERLCREHGVEPAAIGEVYVSVGPGSFTGLRVGVTTAKMLGWSLGAKLVAVPTLAVVARNAPAEAERVAVCLNAKGGRYFAGLFERTEADADAAADELERFAAVWRPRWEGLATLEEVLSRSGRPVTVIGDRLELLQDSERGQSGEGGGGVTVRTGEAAQARGEVVWRLGRAAAKRGAFVEAAALTPHYVRLPEAEQVWRAKQQDVAKG